MTDGIGFTDLEIAQMLGGDDDDKAATIAKRKEERKEQARIRTQKLARLKKRKELELERVKKAEALAASQQAEKDRVVAEADKLAKQGKENVAATVTTSTNASSTIPTAVELVTNADHEPKSIVPPAKQQQQQQQQIKPMNQATDSELDGIIKQKKLIESMNKKKKHLLTDALAKRRAKTQAEHSALRKIEFELSQLDTFLSNDIAILRNRIEEANREALSARQRYQIAEEEYVQAKLNLHSKTELKDQLTEHLILIIQQNEARKSTKLEELMTKMSLSEEDAEIAAERQVQLREKAFADQHAALKIKKEEEATKRKKDKAKQAAADAAHALLTAQTLANGNHVDVEGLHPDTECADTTTTPPLSTTTPTTTTPTTTTRTTTTPTPIPTSTTMETMKATMMSAGSPVTISTENQLEEIAGEGTDVVPVVNNNNNNPDNNNDTKNNNNNNNDNNDKATTPLPDTLPQPTTPPPSTTTMTTATTVLSDANTTPAKS